MGVHAGLRRRWRCHDHGPNHTLNSFRGLFGAIIVRAKGEQKPDRVHNLFAISSRRP